MMPIVIAAAIVLIGFLIAITPPISYSWGNAIVKAAYLFVNTVSCSFRADTYEMRKISNWRHAASRPAVSSVESPIGLRLPYRLGCPIAFCSRPVHRPAIARRLSSWESRRQSLLVSSFRPACRIDRRGDAWDGTGNETGMSDCSLRKPRSSFQQLSVICRKLSRHE